MNIIRTKEKYIRDKVASDTKSLYIFTDNTDRDSGSALVPIESWYSQKYGVGKRYPKVTTALIRGLDNAFPITTQRWYNEKHKGPSGRWWDADFNEFKSVIDDDFNTIVENAHKFEKIIFPIGGIFNSKISNITELRTPKLFKYLMEKCLWLRETVKSL